MWLRHSGLNKDQNFSFTVSFKHERYHLICFMVVDIRWMLEHKLDEVVDEAFKSYCNLNLSARVAD